MQIQEAIYIIMVQVGNLHEDYEVTLDFFIMAQVGNLDICLGGLLQSIFIMAEVDKL